ncbi:VanZ family protein [Paenibacillus sp. SYP-B3998]|uniref:VanZ family protein n=1 Tax=Paenibacillus sp. SYP-B3998 TaxID=2678564 RepID=A0A6G3ZZQ8_9BACL|nr:VanZ family protein [Paenibacillus sp. SYP-B3998]NEW07622.1 VanZ family protein [Paenibacillus sp. SYP-B3998]
MRKTSSTRYYLLLAAALLWMAVIFFKSAESYQQQSLRPLLSSWFQDIDLTKSMPHVEFSYDHDLVSWQDPIGLIEFFIRKAGHVSEYAVLALLWSLALLAKPVKVVIALLTSSIISIIYAATDEWHQSFVAGRTGHPIDVAVDAIGIILAVIVVSIVLFLRAWIKRRRIS